MTTVANLGTLDEAMILRSMLEADGIPVLLPDEYSLQNEGFGSFALGGVRVQVPEDFADRAAEIVAEFERNA